MLLDEDQLKNVEMMASLFFSPETIADNLELDPDDTDMFLAGIEMKTSDAYRFFSRGRLRSEVEIRTAIKMAALNGSSPAQGLMINFFKDSQP